MIDDDEYLQHYINTAVSLAKLEREADASEYIEYIIKNDAGTAQQKDYARRMYVGILYEVAAKHEKAGKFASSLEITLVVRGIIAS